MVALVVLALLLPLEPAAGAHPHPDTSRAMPEAPAQPGPQVDIVVDEVAPTVMRPNQPWSVSGTLRNVGTVSTEIRAIAASTAWVALDTSDAVSSWSTGEQSTRTPRQVGQDEVEEVLAPGDELDFTISVPGKRLRPPFSFTSLPLRLEVTGGDGSTLGQARSVLPWWSTRPAQDRLGVSWVVPLTVPADAALTSAPAPQRAQAWLDAVGPDSSARAWLDGLDQGEATFVVDPALLTPLGRVSADVSTPAGTPVPLPEPTEPAQESPSTQNDQGDVPSQSGPQERSGSADDTSASSSATPTQPDLPELDLPEEASQVQQAEADLQVRLGELSRSQLWWLPVSDPDVAALLDTGADPDLSRQLLRRDLAPSVLEAERVLERGRQGVSWPAFDVVDQRRLRDMRALWPGGAPLATVLPRSAFNETTDLIGQPAGELDSAAAMPVLGYDDQLAKILEEMSSPGQDGADVQLVLAHLLARHQRQPSSPGAVVLSPPRAADVQAETVGSLVQALEEAPWVEQVSAADLLADAEPVRLTGSTPAEAPGRSPLTTARIAEIEAVRGQLADLSGIMPEGGAAQQWDSVLDGLYSTRWRSRDQEWAVPMSEMESQVTTVTGGIQINPTEVNFVAQEGLIQITLVNELPVAVRDLRLGLEPGNARLRILEAPEAVTIGPSSRATVQFRAEAVAAGEVPVQATLSTPSGLTIGDPEELNISVRPTGMWIYWLLGGLAGVILVLGLTRAVRRPSTSGATRQELS